MAQEIERDWISEMKMVSYTWKHCWLFVLLVLLLAMMPDIHASELLPTQVAGTEEVYLSLRVDLAFEEKWPGISSSLEQRARELLAEGGIAIAPPFRVVERAGLPGRTLVIEISFIVLDRRQGCDMAAILFELDLKEWVELSRPPEVKAKGGGKAWVSVWGDRDSAWLKMDDIRAEVEEDLEFYINYFVKQVELANGVVARPPRPQSD